MNLPSALLETIVCPVCKGTLEQVDNTLVCHYDKLSFPIDDGIPVLLEEEATSIE